MGDGFRSTCHYLPVRNVLRACLVFGWTIAKIETSTKHGAVISGWTSPHALSRHRMRDCVA